VDETVLGYFAIENLLQQEKLLAFRAVDEEIGAKLRSLSCVASFDYNAQNINPSKQHRCRHSGNRQE
jgi:hypothetical protein